MKGWGLYIHVPFCPQKCPYCAFAVVIGQKKRHRDYIDAVCSELAMRRHEGPQRPFETVFVGGGTPSLLHADLLARLLDTAASLWGIAADAEITLEANPDRADAGRFADFRRAGFNRLSIGGQSFAAEGLRQLGRRHRVADVTAALAAAKEAGFENIGLDLIFGIPGLTTGQWQQTLERAVALEPQHISAYGLTLEEDTRFFQRHRQGGWTPADEGLEAAQYERAEEVLTAAGYRHYEVSNYARPGFACRHNWTYWSGGPYLGVGQAAHSHVGGRRLWNLDRLRPYLEAIAAGRRPAGGNETIDAATARRERLWLGLRTAPGSPVDSDEAARLRQSRRFAVLAAEGLWGLEGGRLRLTRRGMALADALGVEATDILEQGDGAGPAAAVAATSHYSEGAL